MKKLAVLCSMVWAVGCTSKLIVRPVTGPGSLSANDDGVYYALPKTVLVVDVPIVRNRVVLGEFSDLTSVFFPSAEPPTAEVSYALDEPTLGAFGVPDAKHVYLAVVRGGRFEDKKLGLSFGEDGTIEKIEAESTNHTLEFITQIVKSGASIAGKALGGAASAPDKAAIASPDCDAVERAVTDPKETSDNLRAFAKDQCVKLEAILQKAMRKHVEEGEDLPEKRMRARTFMRAREAALRLRQLRTKRDNMLEPGLLTGAAGDPLKTALDALDMEIDGIVAKFFGVEEKKPYWKATYQVTPDATFIGASAPRTVLLMLFSPTAGVCAAPTAVIAVDVREMLPPPARSAICPKPITIEMTLTRPATQFADTVMTARATPLTGDRGLFYRIPGKSHVVLAVRRTTDTGEVRSGRAQYSPSIAQFGVIESLPASTGGRSTQYSTEFYSSTGALKSFALASEALLDRSVVTDYADATTSLVDARLKRSEQRKNDQKDREAQADELNKLKREADILETQVRIKAAQDRLTPAPTGPGGQ